MSFTHSREFAIQWGDCDPAGIVFYPRYFAMFDWSTAELLGAGLGMTKSKFVKHYGIVGIPMVDTRASFHVPNTYGDVVRIDSRIERFGRSSFDVGHRLMKGDVLSIECWEKRVWVGRHPDDPDKIKAIPIPQEVIEKLK